ncbi:hypothetical protein DEU56DRAFT_908560 [Suillus clintonianus]|uniref:uncharacterized protein n=1 Tax=Suillus clintonianus TaxID=1904413 RepID=UPI001B86A95B|nr:uncharacterized protein DEU56DRAFT_908560 [Suillus clintonianus]KAG2150926.1 hypothetical protein DEU56DRAFT_908560 [Suillus clintonianus]
MPARPGLKRLRLKGKYVAIHFQSLSITFWPSSTILSPQQQVTVLYMPLDIIPADPKIISRMYQSGQPIVLYECQLQGNSCGLHVEGTTSAMSAHLRTFHSITGQDSTSAICTWGGCSKTLKKGSMARHLLTHLGVKSHAILQSPMLSMDPKDVALPLWVGLLPNRADPCGVINDNKSLWNDTLVPKTF